MQTVERSVGDAKLKSSHRLQSSGPTHYNGLMPDRTHAWNLVCQYTQSESLRRHMLAVEAAVRAYARKFGEDEEKWGLVGLLHDFDYERWPNPPDHPLEGAKILA